MKWPKISEWDQPSTQSNGGDLTSYWHIWDYWYRMKHPTFPSGLPFRNGSDGKEGKTGVRICVDRGYPGVQKMYEEAEVLAPTGGSQEKSSRR